MKNWRTKVKPVLTSHLKFIYSEKATKFCEISTINLTTVHTVKSKVEISQNFMAISEYMNYMIQSHAESMKKVVGAL
jgi:hypothetical protein